MGGSVIKRLLSAETLSVLTCVSAVNLVEDPELCLLKDAVELITSLLAKCVLEGAAERRMAAKHNRKRVGI